MFVATPLRSLDMFLRHNGAARAMEASAIDQTRLERLELLARDDMVVNIDNHDRILSFGLTRTYKKPLSVCQAAAHLGILEWWNNGMVFTAFQHSSVPLFPPDFRRRL